MARFRQPVEILIAYWGASGAGKLSHLKFLATANRAPLQVAAPRAADFDAAPAERAGLVYFADLPLPFKANREAVVRIAAVSGIAWFEDSRDCLMQREPAAIVFVADARRSRFEATAESAENLQARLAAAGRTPPIVIAANHFDAAHKVSLDEIEALLPCYAASPSIAITGEAVPEIFRVAVMAAVGLPAPPR